MVGVNKLIRKTWLDQPHAGLSPRCKGATILPRRCFCHLPTLARRSQFSFAYCCALRGTRWHSDTFMMMLLPPYIAVTIWHGVGLAMSFLLQMMMMMMISYLVQHHRPFVEQKVNHQTVSLIRLLCTHVTFGSLSH